MPARYERRNFEDGCRVWIRKYRGLQNMPHWHFESELVLCCGGSCTVTVDDGTYRLREGMGVLVGPEQIHAISSGEDGLVYVAQLQELEGLDLRHNRLRCPLLRENRDLEPKLEQICREVRAKAPFYGQRVNALAALMLVDIFREEGFTRVDEGGTAADQRYGKLLQEIENRCDEITFRDAAAFLSMSEAYFSRFFKKRTGMTFSRYLNTVRVGRAVELLEVDPGITVSELTRKSGFNTLRNFNRVFREITGYAPKNLPGGFSLNIRSLKTAQEPFDPTVDGTEVLP